MVVKSGYKQTEVGLVPEDWEVPYLRQHLLQDATYGVVKAGAFQRTGIPMLRSGEIKNGAVIEDHPFITPEKNKEFSRTILKKNDVVIALVGYPGETAVIPERLVGANISRAVGLLRPAPNLSPEFLTCYLNSPNGRKEFLRPSAGSAQIVVNLGALNKLRLPAPPLHEQRAIATALNDVDGLLGGLDQLIAKKRDLKQAAMQQLLTGKTRLPGFDDEWEVKRLGDVITHCFSGATPRRNRPEFYKGNIRWITSGELNYNVITDTIEKISAEAVAETNLTIHPAGTFLMAITGLEAEGTRGACGIVGAPATTNQSCMAVFPTDALAGEYLFHYYVFRGKSLALQYCQGTKQQSYTASLVKQLPIDLPPSLPEQIAIASVLTEMDGELAVLEQQREKTRTLKEAMMQELLTGRTRLV